MTAALRLGRSVCGAGSTTLTYPQWHQGHLVQWLKQVNGLWFPHALTSPTPTASRLLLEAVSVISRFPSMKSSLSWCWRTKQGVALGILGHNLVLGDRNRVILLSYPDTKSMARPSWKLSQHERIGFKLQFSRQERNCKFNWLEINHFRSHQTKITFFLSRKWNKNSFRKSTILYRKLVHRFFYKNQNFLLATSIKILFPVSFVYGTRQAA